jgi:amino acid adenylation domain-containing protein
MAHSNRPPLQLSPQKRALLNARLGTAAAQANRKLERRPHDGRLPLSYPQRRLWFVEQAMENQVQNNISSVTEIQGPLQPEVLRRCFEEIVRRHEVLRSGFVAEAGNPVQVVHPPAAFPLPLEDLSPLPDDEREPTAMRIAAGEGRTPFDLRQAPLLRARLLRLAPERHLLVTVAHHIVSDGWSIGVLIRELTALYPELLASRPSPLPELPVQYGDFCHWQQELPPERLETLRRYWKAQLAGAVPTVMLPLDHPRPAAPSHRGAMETFRVDAELTGVLKALGQNEGATLFMTLLTAFDVLLHRYSGQEELSIGTPVAGRSHSELEGLIGFFVNLLVLRTDLSGAPSFRQLLSQVREMTLGAYAHQDMPFERLVEELQPARQAGQTPFFQVLFVLQNAPAPQLQVDALRFRMLDLHNGTSKFDLSLEIREEAGSLEGRMEYSSELFERATIQHLVHHFQHLLRELVAHPDVPITRLALVPPEERRTLLRAWNDTWRERAPGRTMHLLVEQQVARAPERTALVWGAQELTYGELNARANQVAHQLIARGVRPEDRVGVCLERTPDLVVAMLGILKAGAGYVPVDPHYPEARREFLVRDSEARLVLTQESLRQTLPEGTPTLTVTECLAGSPERPNPDRTVSDSSVAYLIYTSGSTGHPKGVTIEHRNAVAFLDWVRETFEPEEMRGVLASTSICFDLSIFEMFGTLHLGGTVLLVDNALQLPHLARAGEVTLVNSVPSILREVLRQKALPPSVVTVNLAGEALPGDLVRELHAFPHLRRVYNLYGPSEDTTYSTWALARAEEPGDPPIGLPLHNTRAYVLDAALQPVPVGVTGELYLAGDGLARGYWRRPELTATSFLPDLFSGQPGGRLYKTGDAVFRRADGRLQYRGRVDTQVKVNGFRIELGEIESALRAHPAVADAAVAACEDRGGRTRLVGFCVLRRDAHGERIAVTAQELRRHLGQGLPGHMVPSAFEFLDALPHTPTGKLDRRALTGSSVQEELPAAPGVAPRDEVEQRLASIWGTVLGLKEVSVRSSFFDVGGHSMLAMQMVAQIESAFGVKVPVAQFYSSPTIEELARLVRQDSGTSAAKRPSSLLVPLQPHGPGPAIFCTHPSGGHLMDYKALAAALAFHRQPLYGLQSRGMDEDIAPLRSVQEQAALYVESILSVQPKGPYLLAGYCTGGTVVYEMAQQLRAQGREVAFVGMLDAQAPNQSPEERPTALPPESVARFAAGELGITLDAALFEGVEREDWTDVIWREFVRQSPAASEKLTEPMFRRLFGVYWANSEAVMRYSPQPYSGLVTVFAATPVHFTSPEKYEKVRQAAMGWRQLAQVERLLTPGNHVTMMRPPHVTVLAQMLIEQLGRALGRPLAQATP